MTSKERAEKINESGIHAELRDNDLITVHADYAPAFESASWASLFVGGRFCVVKLELERVSDYDLRFLGDVLVLEHLNLKGNRHITGLLLESLPPTIGLITLDVAHTRVCDGDIERILKFESLETVYGHKDQFPGSCIRRALAENPNLVFRLIY